MDKDDILARSRKENKEQDLYEKEVLIKAGNIAAIAAAVVAAILFVVQIFVGLGVNLGLYAIVFTILAAGFIVKAMYLKRRHEVLVAILYTILVLLCAIGHIYNLVTASTIL